MKLRFLFFAFLLFLGACNNQEEDKQATANSAIKVKEDTLLPMNFYKRLEGTIGNAPVLMHLRRTGADWDGVYSYQQYGKWIKLLFEKDSSRNDTYCFQEYSPVEINTQSDPPIRYLYLKYNSGVMSGTWKSADGKENLPIVLKESYPTGSYKFTPSEYVDAVAAFPKKPKGPQASITFHYLKADGDDAQYKWLNRQLRLQLNLVTPDTSNSWTQELRQQSVAYFRDYRAEAQQLASEEHFSAFLNYESSTDVAIRFNDHGYVIMEQMNYDYSGGAHGNWGSKLIVWDVYQKRMLSLNEVLHAEPAQLQPIVERAFRQQYRLAATDSLSSILFEDQLLPNENFYFTSKGIGFIYNPYEVAAYVMGQVFVFIPYTEVMPLLNPEFKRRMGI